MTTIDTHLPFDLHDLPNPDVYEELLRAAPTTGRCPVWITNWTIGRVGPLTGAERTARLLDVARADPARLLEQAWPGPCPPTCSCSEPLPAWPGLLPVPDRNATALEGDLPVVAAARWARERSWNSALAVVDASRPADVPAVVDWSGAANYDQDVAEISAVLRSWEERFGAVLVELDAATLILSVAAPPMTRQECETVAAEHFAFCPDQQDPQDGRIFTLRSYADLIRGARQWRFWWD
ncbi:DUF4253 domain-containing protein [Pseudonocardia sp. RS11V-5]|uniref:DUF4253 domain-containing protein n=1 Tax=Pseudonocardia terrae TaxID=2905831 RepID=UPI001E5616A1|nr:DUF4253 domain-containing protein [Pseudonocardia terrae]MCE3553611.1 DUF4253 domain-containing protein [Pseudonocardia terrae]